MIVYLKRSIPNDRYPVTKQLRAGQLGILTYIEQSNPVRYWIKWYEDEPEQSLFFDEFKELKSAVAGNPQLISEGSQEQ